MKFKPSRRRRQSRSLFQSLERRQLLADVADINWSGGSNETRATAQGPTDLAVASVDTYRIEGSVGATDASDFFALRPSVSGSLAISQTSWLSGATPNWHLQNTAGTVIAQKTTGTTRVNVTAGTLVFLRVIGGASSVYYSWDVALTATTTGPTPFTGTPVSLPGRVEMENFDRGGQNVAYFDTTPTNLGNSSYRATEAVDMGTGETATDVTIGFIDTSEWLRYSVSVASAGAYILSARVASGVGGGAFRVEFGSTNVTGTMTVPNTGSWITYQTIEQPVTLAAGAQSMRVFFENGAMNISSITLTRAPAGPTPFTGTPVSLPGRVEAENFDRGGQNVAYFDNTPTNLGNSTYRNPEIVDLGTGEGAGDVTVGFIEANEWLRYSVNVTTAGQYTLSARVASGVGGGAFRVEFGTTNVTGTMTVPNTGAWGTYANITQVVTLGAGVQSMRVFFENAGMNLTSITLTPFTTPSGDLGGVPAQRLARLGKGITVGRWFWTPQNVTPFARTGRSDFMADSEIRALYRTGIRNIRLLLGPDAIFASTGNTQGDYDYAFRIFRDGNVTQNWYTSALPGDTAGRNTLFAKWDAIKDAVNRITTVSNAAKQSPTDTDMIVTLVPYEVAATLEFGPYGGDTREPERSNRFNNFAGWWTNFSGRLLSGSNALSPEQVSFELMNEPSFFGQNTYWKTQQRKLIAGVRINDVARRYTIIASATAGRGDAIGDVRGLINFDIDDADKGNIVYNAKFYEPGDIASQGAENLRTSDPTFVGWMHSLPWPASAAAVSTIIPGYRFGQPYNSSVAGYSTFLTYYNRYPWFYTDGARTPQQVADSVFAYGFGIDASESIPGYTPGSGYNLSFLRGRAQQLATWRTREQTPVIISEIGSNASYGLYTSASTYADGLNNDARSAYLRDAKSALDAFNLGWMIWGYDDENAFGVARVNNIAGTTRQSRYVPLDSLRDAGRLISNPDGTLNLARADLDALAAFGLSTSVPARLAAVATGAAAPTSTPAPILTPTKSTRRTVARDLFADSEIV
jgi:hypothetical protein